MVEIGCTWLEKTSKVVVPEEDYICRRLVCIIQQGIASKVMINELRNVFKLIPYQM